MIFVTLGTQDKEFKRILEKLEELNLEDKIIVQAGYTKFISNKMQIFDYLDTEDFKKYLNEANIIITHGGVGNIMQALKLDKKIIAVARLEKYNEHVNDHQLDIVNSFAKKKYLLKYEEDTELLKVIEEVRVFKPNTFKSNNMEFIDLIRKYIEEN